jgi:hypothetical protein
MKTPAEQYGIDLDWLREGKKMTAEETLDWLAAERERVFALEKVVKGQNDKS